MKIWLWAILTDTGHVKGFGLNVTFGTASALFPRHAFFAWTINRGQKRERWLDFNQNSGESPLLNKRILKTSRVAYKELIFRQEHIRPSRHTWDVWVYIHLKGWKLLVSTKLNLLTDYVCISGFFRTKSLDFDWNQAQLKDFDPWMVKRQSSDYKLGQYFQLGGSYILLKM